MTVVATQNNWLLDEDNALKLKLSGFSVPNYGQSTTIPVQVFYSSPDTELVTRTFPHIAISLLDVEFAADRCQHASYFTLPYDLEQATPLNGFSLVADDYPYPWDLIYQIAAFSRQPFHDRQLSIWLYQAFPNTYGSLDMTAFDGTVRRADLRSVVRRDTVDTQEAGQKRIFRQIFTVAISSEFFLNQVVAIQQNTGVSLSLVPYVNEPLPS